MRFKIYEIRCRLTVNKLLITKMNLFNVQQPSYKI